MDRFRRTVVDPAGGGGGYGQVGGHEFVAWDDTSYVSENRRVLQGLHWNNVVWAFSTFQLSNWHPLTLLSHMADVSIWGLNPGRHAQTNVVLHGANSVLLYAFLRRVGFSLAAAGSARILAFSVAVLFAVHPLHVESVAWISERKDVLCAFFWLLALHAYIAYARRPTALAYAWVTLGVVLALLAKPMAVTLPAVFLILDALLLQRASHWRDPFVWRLLYEKLPWFFLAALVGVLTILAQTQAMPPFPPLERLQVALSAYGWYLEKTLWPSGLHFYYLTEAAWSPVRLVASICVLVAITGVVIRERTRHPDWLAGWLWFVVTLLPVVGFVKVGTQAWADRYAYLPHVGLFWMLASMGGCLLTGAWRRAVGGALLVACVIALTFLCLQQVAVWRDTATLYRHAVKQNDGHYVALMGLANHAFREKDFVAAKDYANRAMALSQGPGLIRAMRTLLGDVERAEGDSLSAINHYSIGRDADPLDDGVRVKLGFLLLSGGRLKEAEQAFREAIERSGEPADALNGLGVALSLQGDFTGAYTALRQGIALAPSHRGLRHNLATTALRAGDSALAQQSYRELLERFPDDVIARQALTKLLHLTK